MGPEKATQRGGWGGAGAEPWGVAWQTPPALHDTLFDPRSQAPQV